MTKDDVLQAVIAGAKANGSWDARYGEVSIKEALAPTSIQCEVQPEQEPDELTIAYMSGLYDGKKKRTWVGLTDVKRDEILDIYLTAEGRARAIEAELKELNT